MNICSVSNLNHKHLLTEFFVLYYNFQGLTAIEAWMLACILFVFGALVEYAAILFRKQKVEKKEVSVLENIVLKNVISPKLML